MLMPALYNLAGNRLLDGISASSAWTAWTAPPDSGATGWPR
ncbi:hypothetical protein RAA17_03835 [Komagataeibacter rhaeticus]|nr:hypothetical protein [Komagataeibacter rhaeticus]